MSRTWKLIDSQVLTGILRAAIVAPRSDIRAYLNAVWIVRHDSGKNFLAATNGHTMLIDWLPDGVVDWGPLPDTACRIGLPIASVLQVIKAATVRRMHMGITITATVEGEDPAKWAIPGSRTLSLSSMGAGFETRDIDGTPPDFMRVDPLQKLGDMVEWPALCNIDPNYLLQVAEVAYAGQGKPPKTNPFPVPLVMMLQSTAAARGNGTKELAYLLRNTAMVACPDKAGYRRREPGAWTMVVMPICKLYDGDQGPAVEGWLESLGVPAPTPVV